MVLAQVPKSRGTMMSLNSAVEALGTTIGPAVGGALLILIPGFYGAVGLALGSMLAAQLFLSFSSRKTQLDPDSRVSIFIRFFFFQSGWFPELDGAL